MQPAEAFFPSQFGVKDDGWLSPGRSISHTFLYTIRNGITPEKNARSPRIRMQFLSTDAILPPRGDASREIPLKGDRMAKILVVEDEPLASLELKENLESMGYEVTGTIDSGDQVLASVAKHNPDLVLMDIKLKSFIDGIDAASRMKMISKAPVIYITAYATHETKARAESTHPAAYLVKPVNDDELRREIEAALGAKN